MSGRHRSRDDDRALVRRALERAGGEGDPDASHLVEAVPELLAEARRRRRAAATSPAAQLTLRAWRAIPRLAAATALAVAVAAAAALVEPSAPAAEATSLEALVLPTDALGTNDDLLLDAVLDAEPRNG
jgi:hypothetical protein